MVRILAIFIFIFSSFAFAAQSYAANSSIKNNNIFVTSSITKNDPYLYEPVIYQVKLFTRIDLAQLKFDPLVSNEAVVKPLGSHKVYNTKHNGGDIKVVELAYIIIPLKSGKLAIKSQKINGTLLANQLKNSQSVGGDVQSLFNNFADDSNIVTRSEAFSVASPEVVLDIRPSLGQVKHWLPAEDLAIEGKWQGTAFEVGKPTQYNIIISARGLTGNQLPRISVEELKGSDYKIYAGTSEVKDDVDKLSISSSRSEAYTIIPLKTGKMTLPQIKINWWDIKKKKMVSAVLKHDIIEVADASSEPYSEISPYQVDEILQPEAESQPTMIGTSIAIILALVVLIIAIMLFRRSKLFAITFPRLRLKKRSTLNNAESPGELVRFLQNYAQKNWHSPCNVSLEIMFHCATKVNPKIQRKDYASIIKIIEGALYYNKTADMQMLKKKCSSFLKLTRKKYVIRKRKKKPELERLNPV
ncbi:MAG: BatD family protein [Rickettsiales bacterium]|nr:BatD family protein [Rickettsiales bacterium]MCA0254573.1 BatD family protein [Pseudomonadota bacterium]